MRHGETAWNREGRLQGQREAPLNPRGRDQAAESGALLARALGERGLDAARLAYRCSPLSRARETMEILRGSLDGVLSEALFEERLREIGFGAWEGRTWDDLRRAEPGAMAERRRDTWGFVPPGGGESYAMLLARLAPWAAGLPEDAVVVAHGGVARALMCGLADVAPERAVREEIHQGRVLLFDGGEARWL